MSVYSFCYTLMRVLLPSGNTERDIMLIHSPADLAQYYRDQRKRHGLSQVAVAEEIAVRQDTVSKFELRPDNVRLGTLFRLLAALDMEVHIVPKGPSVSPDKNKKGWTESW